MRRSHSSSAVLGEKGLLSKAIPDFVPRDVQQHMAEAIDRAIALNTHLVIEAGTGIGKTFGYLVPLFLSKKKAIISTGTKNLQDQLFFKDIPLIRKIISASAKVVLLKGRSNYLCLERLETNRSGGLFSSKQLLSDFHKIGEWASVTTSGDIAEVNTVPEDSDVWPYVTSTIDNCLGQDCPLYKKCFVVKARQEALSADVVVVNHHLFFADMVLQKEGFGELLPGADVIIFDEAHHIPDVASVFFSTMLTSRQLMELARDSEMAVMHDAKDITISDSILLLQKAVNAMRVALGIEMRRAPWPERYSSALEKSMVDIRSALQALEAILKIAAVRSKALESVWRRTVQTIERFTLLTNTLSGEDIRWFEMFAQSFSLHVTPTVIADHFKRYTQEEKKRAWIFTSATLTVKNQFTLFIDSLGLHQALSLQLKSPFNYQTQALLYVPRGLPDPKSKNYTEDMIEAAIPVLEMAQGRSFLLFTSYRAMEYAENLLKNRVSFPLLVQGTLPKHELIEKFKQLGNAVLLGTSSFWYGVDVRGDTLSCVIIDKLPFAVPDDPILQARMNRLRQQGIDPFLTYQLPQAILILKQGVGRLIRDTKDRGVLMICDPRLVGANYGAAFLQSLPDMKRTRHLDNVKHFFAEASHENASD